MRSDSDRPALYLETVRTLRAHGSVFAEEEADLLLAEARSADELARMTARRSAGEPLERVLGWALFYGCRIRTAPGVFVPRRRTEFLVDEAIRRAGPRPVVVDLCCGTGAIAAALLTKLDAPSVHAADRDLRAVACARENLGTQARVYAGDLFEALPSSLAGRITLLTANVPYVPSREIPHLPAEARLYESVESLDGGPDGLCVQRRLAAGCRHWLAPGGYVLMESSEVQAEAAATIFLQAGLEASVALSALYGSAVVIGRNPDP